jgi:hypothetical protein
MPFTTGTTMAKAVTCGPYVPYRDGRPRFVPGPRERELGFAGQDLKHESGAWFTFEEARAWAATNARPSPPGAPARRSPRRRRRPIARSPRCSMTGSPRRR